MQDETAERWRTLSAQAAAIEQDLHKAVELIKEISRLLEEKEQRLKQRASAQSPDAAA